MSIHDRGFASMGKAKQREIASKGGKAAHQAGTAHEFTSAEAKAAGRKGGRARAKSDGPRASDEREQVFPVIEGEVVHRNG